MSALTGVAAIVNHARAMRETDYVQRNNAGSIADCVESRKQRYAAPVALAAGARAAPAVAGRAGASAGGRGLAGGLGESSPVGQAMEAIGGSGGGPTAPPKGPPEPHDPEKSPDEKKDEGSLDQGKGDDSKKESPLKPIADEVVGHEMVDFASDVKDAFPKIRMAQANALTNDLGSRFRSAVQNRGASFADAVRQRYAYIPGIMSPNAIAFQGGGRPAISQGGPVHEDTNAATHQHVPRSGLNRVLTRTVGPGIANAVAPRKWGGGWDKQRNSVGTAGLDGAPAASYAGKGVVATPKQGHDKPMSAYQPKGNEQLRAENQRPPQYENSVDRKAQQVVTPLVRQQEKASAAQLRQKGGISSQGTGGGYSEGIHQDSQYGAFGAAGRNPFGK